MKGAERSASKLAKGPFPFWTEKRAAEAVREAGGVLFRVGGSVRDEMLGRSGGDRDYVLTGLSPGQAEQIFPEARSVGKAFSVYRTFLDGRLVEIALARRERKAGVGHRGFAVETDPEVAIEEDLKRRDLTVNAVAVEVLTGRRVDPFRGAEDVRAGILRAVSGAFADDPLRVYRVARFAAQLGFSVDGETLEMMRALRSELTALSPERVWEETRKALGAERPSRYFEVLRASNALDAHFPELGSLVGKAWTAFGVRDGAAPGEERVSKVPGAARMGEEDRYARALFALDAASSLSRREEVRFAALAQGLGRATDTSEEDLGRGEDSVRGEDSAREEDLGRLESGGEGAIRRTGASLANALCHRLRTPQRLRNAAVFAIAHQGELTALPEMGGTDLAVLLTEADRSGLGAEGLACVERAGLEAFGLAQDQWLGRWIAALPEVWREAVREINGNSLKGRSDLAGRAFGRALREERGRRVMALLRKRSGENGARGPGGRG